MMQRKMSGLVGSAPTFQDRASSRDKAPVAVGHRCLSNKPGDADPVNIGTRPEVWLKRALSNRRIRDFADAHVDLVVGQSGQLRRGSYKLTESTAAVLYNKITTQVGWNCATA
jgi:hypothetical protein